MTDDHDIQREDQEFEAVKREHLNKSLPPGVLDHRLERIRARQRARQKEWQAMLAAHPEAKNWKL